MDYDLEDILHSSTELVLINLWADDCDASVVMDELMQEVEPHAPSLVLRLTLTEYRAWAQAHGIYGTPALVAYYQGRLLFRILGRVTPAELRQRLRQYGIKGW